MSPGEALAVVAAGLGAGVLTATVGVASLLSFPVLLAVGLPPVVANASNTVGLTPGALSGSWGYRAELREHPRVTLVVTLTCGVGSIAGALLLLVLPPGVFEAVVPWLILFTCLLVGAQPRISAWVRRRAEARGEVPAERLLPGPFTTAGTALTGVYGGYFGAGSGVMALAVLALGLDIELRVLNALKTLAILAANVVASVIFVVLADLDWAVIGLLAVGSVVGGHVGARIGRRLPAPLLRTLVVLVGVTAAVVLVVG
ncbi:sulfite exporter TauE/SafE family protein [Nocardioides lentus]|uniref:Probable membrane transporter protein n=1 Tax=Nocardioides lentus TaxID=338077 RepID=A0ABN2PH11_9ACTN